MNPRRMLSRDGRHSRRLRARARGVSAVFMDVDGVMTDGGILFIDSGSEGRIFDAKDGVAIWLLRRAGFLTGVISGRTSPAVRRRARELGMEEIHLKVRDKVAVYEEIASRRGLRDGEVCYIGDDVVDLPLLRRVGLSVAPADAHPSVLREVRAITRAPGGRGAIREIADLILEAQGKMPGLMRRIGKGEPA
jgi:3-deoxy-D-manno-octulosonate 8-phosphate phosphatase (KDO 8-P phosphatase)